MLGSRPLAVGMRTSTMHGRQFIQHGARQKTRCPCTTKRQRRVKANEYARLGLGSQSTSGPLFGLATSGTTPFRRLAPCVTRRNLRLAAHYCANCPRPSRSNRRYSAAFLPPSIARYTALDRPDAAAATLLFVAALPRSQCAGLDRGKADSAMDICSSPTRRSDQFVACIEQSPSP